MRALAGVFIFISLILTLYGYFFGGSIFFASLFFWAAFLIFFPTLKSKKLLIVLFFLAILSLAISFALNFKIDYKKLFTINQYLLALLSSVGFLRLIATPKTKSQKSLPKGKGSFLKTYFGVHLFGAVINLSSLIIVADKLNEKRKLTSLQLVTLTRSFASDAFWSPFFVAFGAALTYAPKLEIFTTVLNGLILSSFAFFFTCKEVFSEKKRIKSFEGYPLSFETLYVPLLLALLVMVTHYFYEDLKIIALISLYALFITFMILLFKGGFKKLNGSISLHVKEELPKMSSEISLFLVAGFFGMSASFLLLGLEVGLPFEVFDWRVATIFLAIFLLLGFLGIHPIITIAIVGDLLQAANNTLLAFNGVVT